MTLLSVSVASSGDDALAYSATLGTISGVQTTDTSMILGKFVNNYFYEVFARFNNITIPQGSTINSASVEYELAGNTVGAGNNLVVTWGFHNTDNASAVSNTTMAQTARNNRTTTINETITSTYAIDPARLTSVNISSALQAIVNRVGWASGNSVVLVLAYVSATSQDYVQPYAYDYGGGSNKMTLNVDYTAGVSTFTPKITWFL